MNNINEPWYSYLAACRNEKFAHEAGYFDETKPFVGKYQDVFKLNFTEELDKDIIQYSGAFYPFHEGHLSCILSAIKEISTWQKINLETTRPIHVVIHADHSEYRRSKGDFDEGKFRNAFNEFLDPYANLFSWSLILEDLMPEGCSRNFTRLYTELTESNHQDSDVWFLSGGDRANFALAFSDLGKCIIAGRDQHPNFRRYLHLHGVLKSVDRIFFVSGNHPASSTAIREAA